MGRVQGGNGRGGSFQKVDEDGHSERTFKSGCTREEASTQNSDAKR